MPLVCGDAERCEAVVILCFEIHVGAVKNVFQFSKVFLPCCNKEPCMDIVVAYWELEIVFQKSIHITTLSFIVLTGLFFKASSISAAEAKKDYTG